MIIEDEGENRDDNYEDPDEEDMEDKDAVYNGNVIRL